MRSLIVTENHRKTPGHAALIPLRRFLCPSILTLSILCVHSHQLIYTTLQCSSRQQADCVSDARVIVYAPRHASTRAHTPQAHSSGPGLAQSTLVLKH